MATPDGRLGGESGADGSSVTLSLDTSGTSSAFTWAKGQWAPFRQLPLAKKTQGVCARPGLEVPAARGLAEDRPAPGALAAPGGAAAAGGGAGGLAGPGAVVEGDVTPLGPAGGGLAAVGAVSLAGAPVAAAFVANAAPLVGGRGPGGPDVSSRGAPALSELPLLPATLCRLAVSAARRRAPRLGAQQHIAPTSLLPPDAATRFVNRLFLPIAMAAATSRARERQR